MRLIINSSLKLDHIDDDFGSLFPVEFQRHVILCRLIFALNDFHLVLWRRFNTVLVAVSLLLVHVKNALSVRLCLVSADESS